MFHVHTATEKFENAAITGQFGFVFEENLAGKSRDYRDTEVYKKLRFLMY